MVLPNSSTGFSWVNEKLTVSQIVVKPYNFEESLTTVQERSQSLCLENGRFEDPSTLHTITSACSISWQRSSSPVERLDKHFRLV